MRFQLISASVLALGSSLVSAGVKWAGINIAGFDFGCDIYGNCTTAWVNPPLNGPYGGDGPGQMTHFTNVDKFNVYRLPVGWQYLVNNTLGGVLNTANTAKFDQLVQSCLQTGAYCIIDIHNYGRWNGKVIGESGGPTAQQFASLWSQIASKYRYQSKIVMGLMNEPHDLANVNNWASGPVQSAVNAIRSAGARTQYILLPGNGWSGAGSFVGGGSAAALNAVTDPIGGTSRLIFDLHQYYDTDGSGTHTQCVTNHISDAFSPVATWLRQNKRMALLSETGGGSAESTCITYICQAFDFFNSNSDVYLGWVGWAAGSFDKTYNLLLAPQGSSSGSDQPLVQKCFAGKFGVTTSRVRSLEEVVGGEVQEVEKRKAKVEETIEQPVKVYVAPARRRRRRVDEGFATTFENHAAEEVALV